MAWIKHLSQRGDVAREHRIRSVAQGGYYSAYCSCGYRGPRRGTDLQARDDGAAHVGIEVPTSTSGTCATILRGITRIPSTVSHAIGAGRLLLQTAPDPYRCSHGQCGAIVDRDRAELSKIRANRVLCIHHYELFKRGKLP